jgi:hypothetical protein
VVDVVLVVIVASVVSALMVGITFRLARKASAQMTNLDAELRPQEQRTGRCAACDGAGTRVEAFPGRSGPTVQMVDCFRCGGNGLPLPPGEIARLPGASPLRRSIRQLTEAVELMRAANGHQRPPRGDADP